MCSCLFSPCILSITLIWKIVNSLFGLMVIFHSIWLLICWFFHVLPPTPPHFPPPPTNQNYLLVFMEPTGASDKWIGPWFIYVLLVIGLIGCIITLIIHSTTQNTGRHCTVYVVVILLIMVETLMVADILFDYRWEKDLPSNSTSGFDLEGIRRFVEDNVKICKWFGVGLVAVQAQALPLLFYIGMKHELEQNVRIREPLLIEDSMDTQMFAGNSIISSEVSMDPNHSKTLCESV